jgi:hypothetical protein
VYPRNRAKADEDVSDNENDKCSNHKIHFNMDRRENSSLEQNFSRNIEHEIYTAWMYLSI